MHLSTLKQWSVPKTQPTDNVSNNLRYNKQKCTIDTIVTSYWNGQTVYNYLVLYVSSRGFVGQPPTLVLPLPTNNSTDSTNIKVEFHIPSRITWLIN